jgi:hypothetical protein
MAQPSNLSKYDQVFWSGSVEIFFKLKSSLDFRELLKSLGRLDNKIKIANIGRVMDRPLMKADEKEERRGKIRMLDQQLMSCFSLLTFGTENLFSSWELGGIEGVFCLFRVSLLSAYPAVYWLGMAR